MGQQRSIPLTPLRETVKFIAIEALDEAQRAFFLQHFFDFTGLDTSGAVSEYLDARFRKEHPESEHDQEAQGRRFSTGTRLSRGHYYTLCQDAEGRSGQTLAMELWNYANAKRPFAIDVADLNDEAFRARDRLTADERTEAMAAGWRMLFITVHALAAQTPGLTRALIPYQLKTLERAQVFDLRTRRATDWLFQALNEDWPNAIFLTAKDKGQVDYELVDKLTGGQPRITAIEAAEMSRKEKKQIMRKVRSGPDQDAPRVTAGLDGTHSPLKAYADLFAYLLTPESGGTVFLTILARHISAAGTDALVFPSAREDCGVDVSGAFGFNVVDYAGLDAIAPSYHIVEEPGFFARRWRPTYFSADPPGPHRCQFLRPNAWQWRARKQRAIAIGRHKWWVLKHYLDGAFPDFEIPRLLAGESGAGALEFFAVSKLLCSLYDGTLSLQDNAWGFHWMAAFGSPVMRVGEWLAEFASRQPLFGREPAPLAFDGVRALVPQGSADVAVCVCCGHAETDAARRAMPICQACGFDPEFVSELRSVAPPRG